MRKFEEYLINIRLKANLDQLVVMHAILMIWNFKGKRIVTSFLFCFVFFFLRKKKLVIAAIVQRYCSKVGYSFCWIFFWPLSLPFNSLSEEPKVEKNKLVFSIYFYFSGLEPTLSIVTIATILWWKRAFLIPQQLGAYKHPEKVRNNTSRKIFHSIRIFLYPHLLYFCSLELHRISFAQLLS